ncbi:hypothetical protein HMN09_00918200 [Mycena chlorophos]|uniref:Uncharacterized protein n=1 Tax=Mycena chlorophos TaxID=658473 RepID=A0A8H6SJ73_MYCCL|nr:hypothetical protein HMN09_00918200 [Mycena chlorophos]
MAPGRTATESASLLVSVMKENAELKSILDTKERDVKEAEQALVMLVKENQDLAKAAEKAAETREEDSNRVLYLSERLEEADDEIGRLRAELSRRWDEMRRMEKDIEVLERENASLNRQRDEQDRTHRTWHPRNAAPSTQSERSYLDRSSRSASSSSSIPSSYRRPETIQASAPPSQRQGTSPVKIRRSWIKKPVSERTLLSQYMLRLPCPSTARQGFVPETALHSTYGAEKFLDSFPRRHNALYMHPGRLLWVDPLKHGHALVYAPMYEYHNGSWRPHTQLLNYASAASDVELIVPYHNMMHYAGTYRVLKLRGLEGYQPGDIPGDVDISRTSLYRAMNLRLGVPEDEAKIAQNSAAWPDGKPRVECFGLQHIGFDDELLKSLREQGAGAWRPNWLPRPTLEDRMGPQMSKRKWDNVVKEESDPDHDVGWVKKKREWP